jgi:hypothetical protein
VPQVGNVKLDTISGAFTQITGYQLAAAASGSASVITSGSCTVIRTTCSNTVAGTHVTALDAGTVTLTGPSGTGLNNQKLTESSNTYSYTIGSEGITIPGQASGSILPGTYSLAGAGGTDVGPFSASLTIGSPLTLTLPTTVTESAGLTLNWTGGNASDVVEIIGYSGIGCSGTGTNQAATQAEFICSTTAGQRTYTVPASILTQLPTVTAAQIAAGTANGALEVMSGVTPVNFNAPLKKDGSNIPSAFSSYIGIAGQAAYQ